MSTAVLSAQPSLMGAPATLVHLLLVTVTTIVVGFGAFLQTVPIIADFSAQNTLTYIFAAFVIPTPFIMAAVMLQIYMGRVVERSVGTTSYILCLIVLDVIANIIYPIVGFYASKSTNSWAIQCLPPGEPLLGTGLVVGSGVHTLYTLLTPPMGVGHKLPKPLHFLPLTERTVHHIIFVFAATLYFSAQFMLAAALGVAGGIVCSLFAGYPRLYALNVWLPQKTSRLGVLSSAAFRRRNEAREQ